MLGETQIGKTMKTRREQEEDAGEEYRGGKGEIPCIHTLDQTCLKHLSMNWTYLLNEFVGLNFFDFYVSRSSYHILDIISYL